MQNYPGNPYAPPPGAPPAYGPPPGGYGGPSGPFPPPPPKKSNAWVFLLVGCFGLIFVGGIILAVAGAGVATYVSRSSGGSSGSSVGGRGACAQAAACCRKITAKSGGSDTSACDGLNNSAIPTSTCIQARDSYRKMAPMVGVTCE